MRIDRVHAHAFGPFHDEELRPAPGMTVVHGPNESGKSSWSAAIYGGLCGLRHVGGRPRTADRIFEERHRPWDRDDDAWHASVHVTLDDGRRLHLHADLDGRDDYAVEADTGRDVVAQLDLENDNAPDGARLLGLTRRTILKTILVRQADVLHVLEEPDGLQEHLQQAAATGGDVTAERAIERLDAYHSEHVGTMAWNSKRPLKAAHDRVEACEEDLQAARRAHEEHAGLRTRLQEARDRAARLERQVGAAEAGRARRTLARHEAEHERAAVLAADLPDERPEPADDDERVGAVADAVAAWENRPEEPGLPTGPTVAELEARIAQLPPHPDGATEPAPEVEEAARSLQEARRRLAYHRDSEPAVGHPPSDVPGSPSGPDGGSRSPSEPEPGPESGASPAWSPGRLGLVGGGGLAALVGAGLLAGGAVVPGVVLLVVGVAAAVAGLLRGSGDGRDPAVVERRIAERERETWKRRRQRLEREADDREAALRSTLAGRDVDGTGRDDDVDALLARYRDACRRRAEEAGEAARRDELEARLESRCGAEQQVERARRRREQARTRLREVAGQVGVTAPDPAGLVEGLRARREEVRERQERRARERDRWTRSEALLDGRSLEELRGRVRKLRERLPPLPDGVDEQEAGQLTDRLGALREEAAEAREEVAGLEGRIADREGDPDSVVEAEEALERARSELASVRRLDETLELTRELLEQARERVQHEVAPLLQQAVQERLPELTRGRYAHVRVDPDSLLVQVSPDGTRWRRADRLSQGTAEQVYLLLRVAMAEHAVTTDETAPLILDDVTVHSDPVRTERLLELLRELSRERQVVLFTQEPDVADWARRHLGDDDRLVELDPGAIPA